MVLQAVGCAAWSDVPGNETPTGEYQPRDDTDGRYHGWGPLEDARVLPLQPETGRCAPVDGMTFRVSGTPDGDGLFHDDQSTAGGGANPATAMVPGVTGDHGSGTLQIAVAALSARQQEALVDGVGLWVQAADVPDGTFANLRCYDDSFNADNLEVIRVDEPPQVVACVLYLVGGWPASPVTDPAVPATPHPAVPAPTSPTQLDVVDPLERAPVGSYDPAPLPPDVVDVVDAAPIPRQTPATITVPAPNLGVAPAPAPVLTPIAAVVADANAQLTSPPVGGSTPVPGRPASTTPTADAAERGVLADGAGRRPSTDDPTAAAVAAALEEQGAIDVLTTTPTTTPVLATPTTAPLPMEEEDVVEQAAGTLPLGDEPNLDAVATATLVVIFLAGLGLSVLAARRPL